MRIVCGNCVTLVFLNNVCPFICALEVTISKGIVAKEEIFLQSCGQHTVGKGG